MEIDPQGAVKNEPHHQQQPHPQAAVPPPSHPTAGLSGGQQGTGSAPPEAASAGGGGAAAAAGDGIGRGDATHVSAGGAAAAAAGQQPRPQLSIPKEAVPEPVMGMLHEHAAFLHRCGERFQDCAETIVLLLVTLAKPIIGLLSKEYHFKQAHLRPNVIQALLDGIAVSQPQPKIPPELIKFLGKTYNAWHIAIPLLESHVVMFPNDLRCFDALLELYKLVNEDDMLCGLWRRRCHSEVTKSALSLIQTGHLELAQELLGEAPRHMLPDKLFQQPTKVSQSEQALWIVSRSEQAMWIEQWVGCAKSLCQWDILEEYARETHNQELSLDCLWRLQDWMGLKQTLANKVVQLEESPQMLMIQSYMALHESDIPGSDKRTSQAEMICSDKRTSQATIAALLRWWQLPEVASTPQAHLLQTFQQLVELREDMRVYFDLAQSAANKQEYPYQDVRDITDTWRYGGVVGEKWRWGSGGAVGEVCWRSGIVGWVITDTCRDVAVWLLSYRDKAWSVNKLGAIATAHGHTDTCLNILNTMYGFSAMEVQEAFVKIREQARAYLERPSELMAGLNLLSTTNLDYFGAQHQSEIFRLKGCLLAQMKDTKAAHQSFFQSLYLWKQSAEAWLGWGKLCDELWDKNAAAGMPAPELLDELRDRKAAGGMPTPELLEYTVHCTCRRDEYTAVKLGHAPARGLLPRLLYLLSFDNNITAPPEMQAQLMAQGASPGPWLNVVEASLIKQILMLLALALPQAVYLPLRTFSFSLRDCIQRSVFEYRERQRHVNDAVREKYPHLTTTLDALATEVSTRFAARQEERLLAVVNALLHRCYKLPFAGQHEVPDVLKKELLGVCRVSEGSSTLCAAACDGSRAAGQGSDALGRPAHYACFQDSSSSGKSRRASSSLREEFVRDMHPENPNIPPTLERLMDYLKAFRGRLLCEVEDKAWCCWRPFVCWRGAAGGLWFIGGHRTPCTRQHSHILSHTPTFTNAFGASVGIVRRAGASHRRLAFICSDGHARHMLVQQSQNVSQQSTEERIAQLMRSLNRMLDARPQSRSRALAWHVPMAVVISPGTRLFEEDPSFITYGEAYEVNSLRYGREADMPINVFKKRLLDSRRGLRCPTTCSRGTFLNVRSRIWLAQSFLFSPFFSRRGVDGLIMGGRLTCPSTKKRLAAYHEVCERIVTENVFAQYVYKSLPSCNHLWAFKKTLCLHTALAGLLCRMLLLGGRTPFKVLIAKDTGCMANTDLIPVYDERSGMLQNMEAVPFRLTRNLTSFFSGFGVEGMFCMAMVNAAQAILHKNTNIQHVLALFFRDDVVAWSGRRGTSKNTIVSGLKNEMIKSLVIKNSGAALARLREVAPSAVPEEVQHVLMGRESTVIHGVRALVEAAMEPRNLCKMEATWHPWF
ncbi:hypothetical protein DUNSADRAFT_13399 [Dunaliella salina]|uniref:Non-specific serine/threonine protein kinase n=1 Tax=Dunaliella salina TaxID=3046 RepID=A0ABQ7H373_DUNSA|nr:hypothetical protein DUNSADRAFT_13399 [Dunaliella salina]|eukprot:KAF5841324.1 hypothetical protein DUNSADRAFT_13399 [Dunaliella salina]